jgi:hypothetical protein
MSAARWCARCTTGAVATASGRLVWDGADGEGRGVPSGLYFVETRAEGQVDVLKITLLR